MSKSRKSKQTKGESDDEYDNISENNESVTESIYDDIDEEEIIDDDDDIEADMDAEEEEDADNPECIIEKAIEDDNEYFDNIHESEIKEDVEEKVVSKNERISFNRLTKYEMVRILGERTKQLKLGAKPMVKNYKTLPYEKIAEEELKLNMIPFKIKRPLPNGKVEIWTLDELEKEHLMIYLN